MKSLMPARDHASFESMYRQLIGWWLMAKPFDRGEVHAQKTTTPEMVTKEVLNVNLEMEISAELVSLQSMMSPNLPWAEDHFKERISGEPLNPPPAEAWWPYAQQGNAAHKDGEMFSHTYPERFWPRFANVGNTIKYSERVVTVPHVGIRFEYGDLGDLIGVLLKNPRSRQAYLPVWFPEDLAAAVENERVPCTLGYHFLMTPEGKLDASYYMRSCDLVRFFRDDAYMAGRLLQHVASCVDLEVGSLRMHIANLHAFVGDESHLRTILGTALGRGAAEVDPRASYDFGALG